MSEIRCACRTNLDGYELEEWPQRLAAVPRAGERVASRRGRTLAVVCVTHHEHDRHGDPMPWVEVELNR